MIIVHINESAVQKYFIFFKKNKNIREISHAAMLYISNMYKPVLCAEIH